MALLAADAFPTTATAAAHSALSSWVAKCLAYPFAASREDTLNVLSGYGQLLRLTLQPESLNAFNHSGVSACSSRSASSA
jgi:hypothetical protein